MKYKINFYYYTDLRFSVEVDATNEVAALALAMNELSNSGATNWVSLEKGFAIEIEST